MKYVQGFVSFVVILGLCALSLLLLGFSGRTLWEALVLGWSYGGLL